MNKGNISGIRQPNREPDRPPRLPDDFLFGATIGAHQVEGADYASDWWRWEQRPTRIRDGQTSAPGAGHMERYREDLSLAQKLGHNAVCLSLSWPRIEPEKGVYDAGTLEHYGKVFACARERGLEPMCVLHQVSVPAWFSGEGGWLSEGSADHFARYAAVVGNALGASCTRWIPVYEPEHWLTLACRERRWPCTSGRRNAYGRHLARLTAAQCRAAQALRECASDNAVGVSIRGAIVEPLDPHSPWDERAAVYEQRRLNMRFLDALSAFEDDAAAPDFIGLSYYGKMQVRFAPLYYRGNFALPVDRHGTPASIDNPVDSNEGLEELLSTIAGIGLPLFVTGLGIATEDDARRCRFIREHVTGLINGVCAPDVGLDVRGLFLASLLDGFEWHHGYTRRYGLVHVKHPGLARTPNGSAWFFKDIAKHGCIRAGALEQFCPENDCHGNIKDKQP